MVAREGFVLMIMFFVVTLRSTTSRSEVALKQLQIKLDDLWDIWKVRQVEFDQAFTQCLIRAGVQHFPYPVLQRPDGHSRQPRSCAPSGAL